VRPTLVTTPFSLLPEQMTTALAYFVIFIVIKFPQSSAVETVSNVTKFVNFRDKTWLICSYMHKSGNFGDHLGPYIIHKILHRHFRVPAKINVTTKPYRSTNCLYHLGSVIHYAQPGNHFWGTGINDVQMNKAPNLPPNLTFHAVRGPMTMEHIKEHFITNAEFKSSTTGAFANTVYGDPAILLSVIGLTSAVWCKNDCAHALCFIHHAHDNVTSIPTSVDSVRVHLLSPHVKWDAMINSMINCKFVMSSSLHGLIFSDALSIPSRWVQDPTSRTARTEGRFKYNDYYASTQRLGDCHATSAQQAVALGPVALPQPQVFKKLQKDLLRSFPYQLFEVN
jgi:pyruvyltransferase